MNELTLSVSAIIGIVLPFVVDFVNKNVKTSRTRYLIALLVSILAGGVQTYFNHQWDAKDVFGSIGVIFTLSQTVYKTYWETSKLRVAATGWFQNPPEPPPAGKGKKSKPKVK